MTDARPHAAVGSRVYVLPPHNPCVPDETFRDQLGMFHEVRRMCYHSRHQDLPLGEPHFLPDVVLVLVPYIGRLDRILQGVYLQQKVRDVRSCLPSRILHR